MNFTMDNDTIPQEETMKWLQDTYLMDSGTDSGIQSTAQSGFVSKALSVKSEDDMETDAVSQELMEVKSGRFAPSQSSMSSSMLSELIDENRRFTQYESEDRMNQESTSVVPELITLLNDEDEVVVSQAVKMVLESAQREGSRQAIMSSPEIIHALARVMSSGHDLETTKTAAKIFHHLSHHKQGLLSICRSGSIPTLVKFLEYESVLFIAITTIHNLLLHVDNSKAQVRAAGGVQKLAFMLHKNNVKFLTVVTDCLHLLTYGHQESKLIMLQCNAPAELIRIIQSYDYEKLLWTTTRVLKVLSVCSSNKPAIIASGGMQALARLLRYSTTCVNSSRLLHTALWTLRNLSDAATKIAGLKDLLEALINMLNHVSDGHVITCTVGILSNLTCNNHMNKQIVCQAGGIEALLWTIHNAGDKEDITDPAICALRHLTSKNSESDAAQREIRHCDGIQIIANLFKRSSGWPLIKAIVGLLRNLAQNYENHVTMREQGVIHQLINLLTQVIQLVQNHKNNFGNEDVCISGVRMEEIIEGSLGALQALAPDEQNKSIIVEQQIAPLLAQLMLGNNKLNENIQNYAAEVLSELTNESDLVSSYLSC